ncbi:acyl-protein thioesterase 1 isoform X2 [Cimex lectularius]|uniref:palmitoyl-protein hydrolase n=1 Tax=Cimex lectularius TaxID=79782 RepID=A0A8I6RC91_CIMLE|nr:acyl-protein thioesterase 1 isoform X2 [Cimex lectularius]
MDSGEKVQESFPWKHCHYRLFNCEVRYPDMSTSPVVLAATTKQTATIIFLHGLGDTGHGWASAIGAIRPPFAKVICPTAPTMPVTWNNGFKMPSWFDLKALDASTDEDEAGIKKAAENIHQIIHAEEQAGINSTRIVIGGFSQGGALALYSAFTYKKPLGGVMALSCWLPLHKQFPRLAVGNKATPILQAHGDCDPLVQYKWGQMTASVLKQLNSNVEFKTYKGLGHSSNEDEMADLKSFVEKILVE